MFCYKSSIVNDVAQISGIETIENTVCVSYLLYVSTDLWHFLDRLLQALVLLQTILGSLLKI